MVHSMMLLKKIFPYFFLVVLLLGIIFIWQQVSLPCQHPLAYSIGRIDQQFGLSEADFLKEATEAESLWEGALKKNLFQYVPGAAFHVNLIFDDRQKQTLDGQILEASFGEAQSTQEKLNSEQEKTLARYREVQGQYDRMLLVFKKHLSAYNSEVAKWNKEGDAPKEVYADLQDTAVALEKEQKDVEVMRQQVNGLVKEVNAFSQKKVAVVEVYNEQVERYVNRYGDATKAFDQGEYDGKEINIYQYDDLPHLRAVLVHEFGHALGLVHAGNFRSMMYPLMKDQSLDPIQLSSEDIAMLNVQCGQTVWDIMIERIGFLREKLHFENSSEIVQKW